MGVSHYWQEQPRGQRWQSRPLLERFWARVEKRGPNECWPWTGYRDRNGYGVIYEGHRQKGHKAHRLSWQIANNTDPAMGIRHLCGNASCVNPAHLQPGTQSENMQDMVRHGRAHLAKLDEGAVRELRLRFRHGESIPKLAAEVGLTRQGMRNVVCGRTWKHVPMPEKDGVML